MDNQILINNIKKLCKDNSISISTLERELYMSPGLISRWSKSMPALDRVIEIANYFNVSVDTLIGNACEKNGTEKTIEKLLQKLYQQSVSIEIEWQVFNPKNADQNPTTQKISSILTHNNMDCFYCNVNGGNFILVIKYINEEIELFFYVLADSNSFPELKCTDMHQLWDLYNHLSRLLSKELNHLKTQNFIDDFVQDAKSVNPADKFTLLQGTAVNE